jgi:5-(carboxyamino)imidazole ribonucleotide synthase
MQARVAVLGGGQLGWMLGLAGIPLGCEFAFLDPVAGATASAVGDLIVGALDDVGAARRAAEGATVVTYEWEGVPAATARALEAVAPVYPSANALDVAQDRIVEKEKLRALGIATAPFAAVDSTADLRAALEAIGLPAILKTRRGGYDGKGQVLLHDPASADEAWPGLGEVPCILEGFVPFDRELSIVAVRGRDGEVRCWPAVENHHHDGILRLTRAPAPALDDALQARAEAAIRPLLDDLDYVGVCCVELFEVGDTVLANEIAPRVHNSGHWTIDACSVSQFENHIRAVAGWPLGETERHSNARMDNLIGADANAWERLAGEAGACLHLYGKREARAGRKMGHVTWITSR